MLQQQLATQREEALAVVGGEFIDQTAGRSELFRRQRIEEIAGN